MDSFSLQHHLDDIYQQYPEGDWKPLIGITSNYEGMDATLRYAYYNKVIEYAEKVKSTAGLALEPDYATLFGYDDDKKDCVKRNTSEGILEIHYTTGNGNWETWMYGRQLDDYEYYFTWAKWVTPSRDLIRDFTEEGDA